MTSKSHSKQRRFTNAGFTLIELLVVVAIIAVAATAATDWGDLIKRKALEAEQKRLLIQLNAMQQLAVSTRQEWTLCPTKLSEKETENVLNNCGNNWNKGYQWTSNNEELLDLSGRKHIKNVHLSWNGSNEIVFSPTPWKMHSSMGSFTLCNSQGSYKTVINNGGRIEQHDLIESGCE